ncbi:hypothetical protein HAP94_01885 [Acidithiobacillus ferrivorans]|nr:hypothetical protein [Acidithiobacillus ferrivorans]
MNQTIKTLCEFFEREIPNLAKSYHWNIPRIDGFIPSETSNYHANLELKRHLNNQWISASHERKCEISKIIVSDWGGVKGNKKETLAGYVEAIDKQNPETPLKGIASYSKIFSIARPDQYAIYDARVAACLNAVQLNADIQGVCFNYVPGRNNIVGNYVNNCGFTKTPQFSKDSLTIAGWSGLKKNETYEKYNEVLSTCLRELQNKKRYELEMALFTEAERECQKQLRAVGAM